MGRTPTVRTIGSGIDQLLLYFALFDSEPANKLPRDQSKWVTGAMYDAPHGFVSLSESGDWAAECCYSSVQFCKERVGPDKQPDIAMKNSPEKLAGIIRKKLKLPTMCVEIQ